MFKHIPGQNDIKAFIVKGLLTSGPKRHTLNITLITRAGCAAGAHSKLGYDKSPILPIPANTRTPLFRTDLLDRDIQLKAESPDIKLVAENPVIRAAKADAGAVLEVEINPRLHPPAPAIG